MVSKERCEFDICNVFHLELGEEKGEEKGEEEDKEWQRYKYNLGGM